MALRGRRGEYRGFDRERTEGSIARGQRDPLRIAIQTSELENLLNSPEMLPPIPLRSDIENYRSSELPDRRQFHPDRSSRDSSERTESYPRSSPVMPFQDTPWEPVFGNVVPHKITYARTNVPDCVKRAVRREVLHAKKLAGRRGAKYPRRRSPRTEIICD